MITKLINSLRASIVKVADVIGKEESNNSENWAAMLPLPPK